MKLTTNYGWMIMVYMNARTELYYSIKIEKQSSNKITIRFAKLSRDLRERVYKV